VTFESPHLVLHYVKGSAADRDLGQITRKRELACQSISDALGVKLEKKIDIYLYPTRESTRSGLGEGSTKDMNTILVNYYDFTPCYEKIHFGHELTHAISARLVKSHLALLSEGLAEYLDQSGRDLHASFSHHSRIFDHRVPFRMEREDVIDQRDYSRYLLLYTKGGSFVKFLVEGSGWKRFRDFYRATANLGILHPLEDFAKKYKEIYGEELVIAEARWNAVLAPYCTAFELPRLAKSDDAAVRSLFAEQDAAASLHDATRIASTYDRLNRKMNSQFEATMNYYANGLVSTELQDVFDLGIKNGHYALVNAVRHFNDGSTHQIQYKVEKMEDGWTIQSEDWSSARP